MQGSTYLPLSSPFRSSSGSIQFLYYVERVYSAKLVKKQMATISHTHTYYISLIRVYATIYLSNAIMFMAINNNVYELLLWVRSTGKLQTHEPVREDLNWTQHLEPAKQDLLSGSAPTTRVLLLRQTSAIRTTWSNRGGGCGGGPIPRHCRLVKSGKCGV